MTPPEHRPGALIVTVPFAPFHTRRPAATKIFPGPLPISAPSLITLKRTGRTTAGTGGVLP